MHRESSHSLEHWRMSKDNRGFLDHFDGDTINLDRFAVDGDTGTTNFAQRVGDATGTYVRGQTATDDNEGVIIYTPAHYFGDKDCGMEVAFKTDVVTNLHFEIGFVDALTDKTLGAINDIDTPTLTNGAGDAAFVCMDTDQTLTTMALVTVGSGAIAAAGKVDISTLAPTADTLMVVRIQLLGNNVVAIVNDNKTYEVFRAPAIEGGTAVFAYAYFQNRSAAEHIVDIDWFETWGDR